MGIKNHTKKIMVIFGTRPEAIKMAPVILELKNKKEFEVLVCVTAQHREMLDQVLELFEIQPDYDLNIMVPGQDLFEVTSRTLMGLRDTLDTTQPDIVVVHGDTTTTMAASLAAFYKKIPVGHVEAGLRTKNKYAPFPEEMNRKITTAVTDLHFAPTDCAKQNLLGEGVSPDTVFVTGNTVIDALFLTIAKLESKPNQQQQIASSFSFLAKNKKMLLVTGHRRENFGEGLANICSALVELAKKYPDMEIVYPAHMNPNVLNTVHDILLHAGCRNIHVIKPLDYVSFVYLMKQCYMILTDSGGVQEEAPSLGKPVFVMREATERPEAVEAGTVCLVGSDREKIVNTVSLLLENNSAYERMSKAHNPYGDGTAAQQICAILLKSL